MDTEKAVVRFENETAYSEEIFKSVYANHYFTSPLMIVAWFLALRPIGVILGAAADLGAVLLTSLLPLVALALLVVFMFFRAVKQATERELALGGGQWPRRTIQVFNDHIYMRTSAGGEFQTPLHEVKNVRVTKTYIQVKTDDKMIYILSRGDFTVGTFEECAYHLQSKIQRRSFFSNL